jgi:hypothetical protein
MTEITRCTAVSRNNTNGDKEEIEVQHDHSFKVLKMPINSSKSKRTSERYRATTTPGRFLMAEDKSRN